MSEDAVNEPLAPRRSESLLMRVAAEVSFFRQRTPTHVICTSLGRAQLAQAIAQRWPSARVACNFLDLYSSDQARPFASSTANLAITCLSDLPFSDGTCELALLPLQATGDAELTRELLQTAHGRLQIGGELWISTDNPRDHWLSDEMRKLFSKIKTHRFEEGVVYGAAKQRLLKKKKDFSCEFAFRDGERLIHVYSRAGVFSHRHIDLGARALIEAMNVRCGDRVMDIGCGAGVVSLAASARAERVHILALDSNPRAVECTQASAVRNGFSNIVASLNADATCDQPNSYDLVLGNPPYFSRHRISEIFLRGAEMALKPAGKVMIVTKDLQWYAEIMPSRFDNVTVEERRGYAIVCGEKRGD